MWRSGEARATPGIGDVGFEAVRGAHKVAGQLCRATWVVPSQAYQGTAMEHRLLGRPVSTVTPS